MHTVLALLKSKKPLVNKGESRVKFFEQYLEVNNIWTIEDYDEIKEMLSYEDWNSTDILMKLWFNDTCSIMLKL